MTLQEVENWVDAILALIEFLPASAAASSAASDPLHRKFLPSSVKADVRPRRRSVNVFCLLDPSQAIGDMRQEIRHLHPKAEDLTLCLPSMA